MRLHENAPELAYHILFYGTHNKSIFSASDQVELARQTPEAASYFIDIFSHYVLTADGRKILLERGKTVAKWLWSIAASQPVFSYVCGKLCYDNKLDFNYAYKILKRVDESSPDYASAMKLCGYALIHAECVPSESSEEAAKRESTAYYHFIESAKHGDLEAKKMAISLKYIYAEKTVQNADGTVEKIDAVVEKKQSASYKGFFVMREITHEDYSPAGVICLESPTTTKNCP